MRRLTLCVVAAVAAMAVPSVAVAGGGPPVVFTETIADTVTLPFPACDGSPGVVTVSFRDTFHITEFDDGRVSVTANQRGTFSFVPDDGGPTSTGRYRNGFHVTATDTNYIETSVFVGTGVDEDANREGFQALFHVTVVNGEVSVLIDSMTCR